MTAAPLPDSWDDEPWPLDDPTPTPSLRPTNWSDTHDQPPQVADLADEAWQYAVDHGISMERALVELQHLELARRSAAARIDAHVQRLGPDLIGRDMRRVFHSGGIVGPVKTGPSWPTTAELMQDQMVRRVIDYHPTAEQINRLLDTRGIV